MSAHGYRWVTGVAIATLSTAALTGCGTQSSTNDGATASTPSATEVHAEAQRVYESFTGSQEQLDAAYVVQAYANNGPLDKCLEERGYPEWDWSLARAYAPYYDALRPTVWFAQPGNRIYSEREITAQPYLEATNAMEDVDRFPTEFPADLLECEHSIKPPSDAEIEKEAFPPGWMKLIEAWRTAMREVGEKLGGSFDTYYDCMGAADLAVLKDNDATYDDLSPVMRTEAAKAGKPPAEGADPSTYTAAWKRFLETEDQVLAADTACRSDIYNRDIGKVMATITEFAEKHADEIAAIQEGWKDIAAKAEQLGYHGQVGPLGK